MYALFYKDKQISKSHKTREQCEIEAFEEKAIYHCRDGRFLDSRYEIREIKDQEDDGA
jgi:hypothetical protein